MQRSMRTCWRMPTDLPDPHRLVVTVAFELTREGQLNGEPRVTSPARIGFFDLAMRSAVNRAVSAARNCAPYSFHEDPVLTDHYDVWRAQELTFRAP